MDLQGSTLNGTSLNHEHGFLTLPCSKPRGKHHLKGEGSMLGREDHGPLPPQVEPTHWGLQVGMTTSSSLQATRIRPLHEQDGTTSARAPRARRTTEKMQGSSRGGEEGRRGRERASGGE
ncbi:hypothetical protein Taro_029925 [Colocasia esculenta]|uniref:Uncharacterized protein n=1 Tax=Colocasia esculenta TaxID=4460 RepID=A0A843VK73_COLES|nr:hypothetical protein [Colocasia esculenta]